MMEKISQQVGYDVLVCNNNNIKPLSDLQNTDLQRVVIFDDFVCKKKTRSLWLITLYEGAIKTVHLFIYHRVIMQHQNL